MTIKEFAKICGCNAQTLRYYDSQRLLKPKKVDHYSGYRYYDKEQALEYVKIKNLQEAGFSLEEIKTLLKQDDNSIFETFDEKNKLRFLNFSIFDQFHLSKNAFFLVEYH